MTPLYNECRSALVAMVLLCLAALAAPAAAQTVVDGSDRNVPPGSLAAAVEAAADRGLFDPYGAQFRGLQIAADRPDYLCGWINAKNRLGAFTGFRPFIYGDGFFNLLPPEDDINHEIFALTFKYISCPRN